MGVELREVTDWRTCVNPEIAAKVRDGSATTLTKKYVATVDGVEVAYVALDWWPRTMRDQLDFYQVAVLPEFQMRGIGTHILAAVEKLARDAGYPVIKLVARPLGDISQEKLKSWYRTNGYIDSHADSDEMEKQINPEAGV